MLEVKINREIREYQENIFFGLNLRQFTFSILAIALALEMVAEGNLNMFAHQTKNNLPDVVFHSLRHSSTTYKLKFNGGDMKSVQGDTGHAQLKMVSDVYSHILDEDRRHNAEMFEDAFYKKTPTAQKKETSTSTDAQQVMELLNASPDLASQLLKMLQIVNGGTQNAV